MPENFCDGWGLIVCRCAGDFCLCGMNQEECPGCEACESVDLEYDAYVEDHRNEC